MIKLEKKESKKKEYLQEEQLPGLEGIFLRVSTENKVSVGGAGWGTSLNAFYMIAKSLGVGDKVAHSLDTLTGGTWR